MDVSEMISGQLDCFVDFGGYRMCDKTLFVSIQSSLIAMMAQALLCRIFTPGTSIFVNSSVILLLCRLLAACQIISHITDFEIKHGGHNHEVKAITSNYTIMKSK
jgi:hypothetical protein